MEKYIYGVDLSSTVVHVVQGNSRGREISREMVHRAEFNKFLDKVPEGSTICVESCSGSHDVVKEGSKRGLKVKALPAQHTARFRTKQKNDYNDAKAILTAYFHEDVIAAGMKTDEELDLQALHRRRELLTKQYVELTNQIRGMLRERNRKLRCGKKALGEYVTTQLDKDERISESLKEVVKDGYAEVVKLTEAIAKVDKKLKDHLKKNATAQKLLEIPGVGAIVATYACTLQSQIHMFKNGRAFTAAKVGTVPSQHSTGGETELGRITKIGDQYLRTKLVQGTQSLIRVAPERKDELSLWIQQLLKRKHRNVVAIALANKIARIIWRVLAKGERYNPAMTNGQLPQSV